MPWAGVFLAGRISITQAVMHDFPSSATAEQESQKVARGIKPKCFHVAVRESKLASNLTGLITTSANTHAQRRTS